jgi:hypothetical protein
VRVHRLGADILPAAGGSALRVELHDAGLPPRVAPACAPRFRPGSTRSDP